LPESASVAAVYDRRTSLETGFVRSLQNKISAVPKNLEKIFNQKTRRITHNSIFADLLHVLDFDKFRRDDEIQNCTVKDQLFSPRHTAKPTLNNQHSSIKQRIGLPCLVAVATARREEHSGNPEVRMVAGRAR
jgi:hypothetical protein